ncbi:hypothetical protein Tco_0149078 [Tanacetum coccineum]
MDGRTKKALFHYWINGSWNKRPMNDIVSRDENEWEISAMETLQHYTLHLFLKPCLKAQEINDIEKEGERSQMIRKDLVGKKSTMLVKYLQSGILAHKINNEESLPSKISSNYGVLGEDKAKNRHAL